MSQAIDDVVAERKRQIDAEGFTIEHDDDHGDRSLVAAAICYATHYFGRQWMADDKGLGLHEYQRDVVPDDWPWDIAFWKPKNPRQDLIRAAALIIAEIERLDRANGFPHGL